MPRHLKAWGATATSHSKPDSHDLLLTSASPESLPPTTISLKEYIISKANGLENLAVHVDWIQ